jgi:hypothetical protein
MTQEPRTFSAYAPTLKLFLEEEVLGDALFGTLASFHQGRAHEALQLMAAIERAMVVALQPALDRHGLTLADLEGLREEGRSEAEAMRNMTWADFLDHIEADYPAFLDEFGQLLRLAPEADKADAQLLFDHEVALMDFAAAERQEAAGSLEILSSFLQRLPRT